MNYNFKTYFLMLAHYNQWANTKLFAILGTLTEEQLNQDCHAYFKSLIQNLTDEYFHHHQIHPGHHAQGCRRRR